MHITMVVILMDTEKYGDTASVLLQAGCCLLLQFWRHQHESITRYISTLTPKPIDGTYKHIWVPKSPDTLESI